MVGADGVVADQVSIGSCGGAEDFGASHAGISGITTGFHGAEAYSFDGGGGENSEAEGGGGESEAED